MEKCCSQLMVETPNFRRFGSDDFPFQKGDFHGSSRWFSAEYLELVGALVDPPLKKRCWCPRDDIELDK